MGWYDHVPDASVVVDCEGGRHVVRWSAGDLALDAHPDVAAERVLVALGGTPPACLAVADLWEAAVADGGFLWEWAAGDIGPARRAWLQTALERVRNEGVQEFLHRLPIRRAERMGRVLAMLPPTMVDRAAMAVAWRLEADPDPSLDEPLAEAVGRRLRRAFVASVGGLGGVQTAALVPLRWRVEGRSHPPAVTGRLAGRSSAVVVTVGASWLAHVWARQVTVVEGAMVLAATEREGGLDTTMLQWRPAGGGLEPHLRTVSVEHVDGRWRRRRDQGAVAAGGRTTRLVSPPQSR
jgi:hypothetical protein